MNKLLVNKSRFISLVLRHKPEEIGLVLDENGWADVNELLTKASSNGSVFTMAELEEIVATNEKKRFSFNETKTRIRANQGHSIDVDVQLKEAAPPAYLYHGTAEKNLEVILQSGINKMSRQHVHLTDKLDTAKQVGSRHGKPVVLEVDTIRMQQNAVVFYLSENGVWLTDFVAPQYLKVLE